MLQSTHSLRVTILYKAYVFRKVLRFCSSSRAKRKRIDSSAKWSLSVYNSFKLVNLTADLILKFYFLKSYIYFLNPLIIARMVDSAGLILSRELLKAVLGFCCDS
jgi:hypothetical protein